MNRPPSLHIVVASTRPVRLGASIGAWFLEITKQHGVFASELVDLRELNLPLLDEEELPHSGIYANNHTKQWSATVDRADAFAFVIPEYNHGPPASLLNAISYLHREWQYKPICFVNYGGVSGGTRSSASLKQVVTALKMMPIPEAVSIPFVLQHFENDRFGPGAEFGEAATVMLNELSRWTSAMSTLRASGTATADGARH